MTSWIKKKREKTQSNQQPPTKQDLNQPCLTLRFNAKFHIKYSDLCDNMSANTCNDNGEVPTTVTVSATTMNIQPTMLMTTNTDKEPHQPPCDELTVVMTTLEGARNNTKQLKDTTPLTYKSTNGKQTGPTASTKCREGDKSSVQVVQLKTTMEIFVDYVLTACDNDWVPGTAGMKSHRLFTDATWVTINSVIGVCQETNCIAPTAIILIRIYEGTIIAIALDWQVSRLVEFSSSLLHSYFKVKQAKVNDFQRKSDTFLEESKSNLKEEVPFMTPVESEEVKLIFDNNKYPHILANCLTNKADHTFKWLQTAAVCSPDNAQTSNLSVTLLPFTDIRSNKLKESIIDNLKLMHTDKETHFSSNTEELFHKAFILPHIASNLIPACN